jgi:hypothetical protein
MNNINKYGLSVSPCIVPLCTCIGFVFSNYSPIYIVVELLYIFPIISIASSGYPRSSIIVSSLAWSMDPKAFLKFMYRMCMSWLINLTSSSTTMSFRICLVVLFSYLIPLGYFVVFDFFHHM